MVWDAASSLVRTSSRDSNRGDIVGCWSGITNCVCHLFPYLFDFLALLLRPDLIEPETRAVVKMKPFCSSAVNEN